MVHYGLTHKSKVESLARYKHSSLYCLFFTDDEKSFVTLTAVAGTISVIKVIIDNSSRLILT
jgi:hypothetical protein